MEHTLCAGRQESYHRSTRHTPWEFMHQTQAGAEKKTGHLHWISQILMELGAGMMNDPPAEETA